MDSDRHCTLDRCNCQAPTEERGRLCYPRRDVSNLLGHACMRSAVAIDAHDNCWCSSLAGGWNANIIIVTRSLQARQQRPAQGFREAVTAAVVASGVAGVS